jgi:phosphoglycolate phosphatase-like HAD superfamily hydrolase
MPTSPTAPPMPDADGPVIRWLLDADPAIRWQVLRDLTDAPARRVAAERAKVATEGWGARLLAMQGSDGRWGGAAWNRGWDSTMHVLWLLRHLGLDPASDEARHAASLVRDHVTWQGAGPPECAANRFFAGEVEPCINGQVAMAGAYFNQDVRGVIDRLLGEQLPDGGWNCDAPHRSVRSSFNTTICVLEALLEYGLAGGPDRRVTEARLRRPGGRNRSVVRRGRPTCTGGAARGDSARRPHGSASPATPQYGKVALPRYKLVIFDFDGTLADTFPWFAGIFNDVADRFGFARHEPAAIERLRGLSGRELIRHLGIPAWKIPLIARHVRRLKSRDAASIRLFGGVPALLRRLNTAGAELAVVSSNAYPNVRTIMGADNVSLVTQFECGASLFGKKSRFERVRRRSGLAPSEILCVGDEIRDAEAARTAGIPFGAVTWGFTTREALLAQRPAELFSRVDEIGHVIIGGRSRTA